MASAIMVQGTCSGVGKSFVVAGLCRIFRDMGLNPAPFKAQNISLNSFITSGCGEIARSQALQAEAAGIPPLIHMNPVLLKPAGIGAQVILEGKVYSTMRFSEYNALKDTVWQSVCRSIDALMEKYRILVIEGAGSPAEINLQKDIVNMAVAKRANAPVILVANIELGGAFASLYGTVALLGEDSRWIKAFLINNFIGDKKSLQLGSSELKRRCGIPLVGTIPYLGDLALHEEDSIPVSRFSLSRQAEIKIAILALEHIANFTDFDPFACEVDVDYVYTKSPRDIANCDLLIIPGSKNTITDLLILRKSGLERAIIDAARRGTMTVGICGGYQMLGKTIADPFCMESDCRQVRAMGLLDIATVFDKTKITCQAKAVLQSALPFASMATKIDCYEIHMGRSEGEQTMFSVERLINGSFAAGIADGSVRENVWGCYLHGIFDNDIFRRGLINYLRSLKQLAPIASHVNYASIRDKAINTCANALRQNIDIDYLLKLIGSCK